jgi:drug/metabolite transporter (DMT)-like permease
VFNKVLSTLGLWAGITGAFLVASNAGLFVLGYSLFITSSLSWVLYSIRTKQINLMVMNIVFTIINAMGLYNFS